MPAHVRKGDQVMITAGDHKGKVGEVMRVMPDKEQVLVKGINLRTRHLRATPQNRAGGIVTKEAPIHMSNVSPVVDGRPCRVRFETRDDGSKVRVAVRSGGGEGKVLGQVSPSRKKR